MEACPYPMGFTAAHLCQAGPVIAFSGFVDISGGDSQSGAFSAYYY